MAGGMSLFGMLWWGNLRARSLVALLPHLFCMTRNWSHVCCDGKVVMDLWEILSIWRAFIGMQPFRNHVKLVSLSYIQLMTWWTMKDMYWLFLRLVIDMDWVSIIVRFGLLSITIWACSAFVWWQPFKDWQVKGHHVQYSMHSLTTGVANKCLLPEPSINFHANLAWGMDKNLKWWEEQLWVIWNCKMPLEQRLFFWRCLVGALPSCW